MIVFLTVAYVALLFVLTRIRVLPNSRFTWLTVAPYVLALLVFFFIPMQWGAPKGDVRTLTYSVQVTPNVVGQVIEVPVEPNAPLRAGDVLFRLDPTPYQAALDSLTAKLELAEIRLDQTETLAARQAGSVYDVQAYQAEVDGLKAQIANAEYNLAETVVRAPSDGYVTNVALRPGARVSNFPFYQAMSFVDTSEVLLGAQIPQIYARHIEPGQEAEVTFKVRPGQTFGATVEAILPATAQGQVRLSGFAPEAQPATPGPFFVRLRMDDAVVAQNLPSGALGSVAIYTSEVEAAHIIRRVMIRMEAWMNYLNPY